MFKGQKVVLRAVKREDMERQWIAENDPELYYLDGGRPRPSSLDDLYKYFDQNARRDDEIEFAIEADGKYIGHCGLHGFDSTNRTAELSVEIGDKGYWGQGYGRDAIRLLLGYAFEHMNLNRVHLTTHSENERAIRCYRACGFVEEGRMRQHLYVRGHYVDRVVMGMLREEYTAPTDPMG
jgi:RimJ/RimL family protein N-acetyltransferase